MMFPSIVPNSSDLLFREFSAMCAGICKTTFTFTIRDIVGLRAEAQMRRIYTCWRVAYVQYVQACRNWSVRHYPRHSMRVHIAPIAAVRKVKAAIAFIIELTLPQPARICFQNFGPKSIFKWYAADSHAGIASSDLCVVRSAAGSQSCSRFSNSTIKLRRY